MEVMGGTKRRNEIELDLNERDPKRIDRSDANHPTAGATHQTRDAHARPANAVPTDALKRDAVKSDVLVIGNRDDSPLFLALNALVRSHDLGRECCFRQNRSIPSTAHPVHCHWSYPEVARLRRLLCGDGCVKHDTWRLVIENSPDVVHQLWRQFIAAVLTMLHPEQIRHTHAYWLVHEGIYATNPQRSNRLPSAVQFPADGVRLPAEPSVVDIGEVLVFEDFITGSDDNFLEAVACGYEAAFILINFLSLENSVAESVIAQCPMTQLRVDESAAAHAVAVLTLAVQHPGHFNRAWLEMILTVLGNLIVSLPSVHNSRTYFVANGSSSLTSLTKNELADDDATSLTWRKSSDRDAILLDLFLSWMPIWPRELASLVSNYLGPGLIWFLVWLIRTFPMFQKDSAHLLIDLWNRSHLPADLTNELAFAIMKHCRMLTAGFSRDKLIERLTQDKGNHSPGLWNLTPVDCALEPEWILVVAQIIDEHLILPAQCLQYHADLVNDEDAPKHPFQKPCCLVNTGSTIDLGCRDKSTGQTNASTPTLPAASHSSTHTDLTKSSVSASVAGCVAASVDSAAAVPDPRQALATMGDEVLESRPAVVTELRTAPRNLQWNMSVPTSNLTARVSGLLPSAGPSTIGFAAAVANPSAQGHVFNQPARQRLWLPSHEVQRARLRLAFKRLQKMLVKTDLPRHSWERLLSHRLFERMVRWMSPTRPCAVPKHWTISEEVVKLLIGPAVCGRKLKDFTDILMKTMVVTLPGIVDVGRKRLQTHDGRLPEWYLRLFTHVWFYTSLPQTRSPNPSANESAPHAHPLWSTLTLLPHGTEVLAAVFLKTAPTFVHSRDYEFTSDSDEE
jgi:hypothetical protein